MNAPRAVLLDALGTLVELRPPWPALVRELAARGVAVGEDEARGALRAEMAYYRAHCHEAGDHAALADLRARCTEIVRDALGPPVAAVPDLEDALLASLEFAPFPEVRGVLRELRGHGARLVVVSNWDISLHDVLAATGLRELVDGVITSAEHGASKPDPSIFAAALALAGADASEALHAGDDVEADVRGAQAAGIEPVLVARDGEPAPPGVRVARSLEGLLAG